MSKRTISLTKKKNVRARFRSTVWKNIEFPRVESQSSRLGSIQRVVYTFGHSRATDLEPRMRRIIMINSILFVIISFVAKIDCFQRLRTLWFYRIVEISSCNLNDGLDNCFVFSRSMRRNTLSFYTFPLRSLLLRISQRATSSFLSFHVTHRCLGVVLRNDK